MTNPYFNFIKQNNEETLLQNFEVESIQIYGQDLQYLPKTLVNYSKLYGEDPQRAFLSKYTIEAYPDNLQGWGGDLNFINKEGLNIEKQMVFVISKRRFDEVVLGFNFKGDWVPQSYNLNDGVQYNQNNLFITDFIIGQVSIRLSSITGTFTPGDLIQGSVSGNTGEIVIYTPSTNTITVNTSGSFSIGETITDLTNSITACIKNFELQTFVPGDLVIGQTSGAQGYVCTFVSPILSITPILGPDFIEGEIIVDSNGTTATLSSVTITVPGTIYISQITNNTNIPGIDTTWKIMVQVAPNEGDLIYWPLTHDVFEILFKDFEQIFYQVGKIYVWKITCEKFQFSHEKFSTGNPDIDSIAADLANDNSVVNDPLADNVVVQHKIEDFLNIDPNAPFVGDN
jgi:hypothetical protein